MTQSPMTPMSMVGKKHPALHRPAEPVTDIEHANYLATRMRATLGPLRGLALAAPQVGHSLALVVLARGPWSTSTVMNPRIADAGGELIEAAEGCLSLPGRWYLVPRYATVKVEGETLGGQPLVIEATDQEARLWQHECDHLAGKIISTSYPETRQPR